jgi:CheY-like chemotaxis protein
MESRFCLMEVGATWAQSLRPLPIVVPPVSFDEVTRTLGLRQAWLITNSDMLQGVRETVIEALEIGGNGNHTFDRKRKRWDIELPTALSKLAQTRLVNRAELTETLAEKELLESKYASLEKEIGKIRHELAVLQRMRPVALIIESQPLIAQDLTQILTAQGFVVAGVARTEKDAVELAHRTKPDIITAEIVLDDGSSGLNAVNRILSFCDAFPIFVTAYPERLLEGTRPEPAALVTKPFDPAVMTAVLSEGHAHMLRKWEYQEKANERGL